MIEMAIGFLVGWLACEVYVNWKYIIKKRIK